MLGQVAAPDTQIPAPLQKAPQIHFQHLNSMPWIQICIILGCTT
jgi:hypothetical protein